MLWLVALAGFYENPPGVTDVRSRRWFHGHLVAQGMEALGMVKDGGAAATVLEVVGAQIGVVAAGISSSRVPDCPANEVGADMGRFPSSAHRALLGPRLPWQQREGREAAKRQDREREPLARARLGASSPCRWPRQGHLPGGAIPSTCRTPGSQEGGGSRGPRHSRHRLPLAQGSLA